MGNWKNRQPQLFLQYLLSYACIMLVPLVMLSLLSYGMLRARLMSQRDHARLEALGYTAQLIDQQLAGLNSMAAEMAFKSCFNKGEEADIRDYHDIAAYLKSNKAKNQFVYDILYADVAGRRIYTSSGLYREQDFEDNLYHYQGSDLFAHMEGIEPGHISFIPLGHALQYGRPLQILTAAVPVSYTYSGGQRQVSGCAVFIIEKATLDALIQTALHSETSLGALFYADQLVYCSRGELMGGLPSYEALSGGGMHFIAGEAYGAFAGLEPEGGGMFSLVGLVPERELNELGRIILWSVSIVAALTLALCSVLIFFLMRINYRPLRGLFSFARQQLHSFPERMGEVEATQYVISQLAEQHSELAERNRLLQREHCFYALLDENRPLEEGFQTQCLLAGLPLDGPCYRAAILESGAQTLALLEGGFPGIQAYWEDSVIPKQTILLMSGTPEALEEAAQRVSGWPVPSGVGPAAGSLSGLRLSFREARRLGGADMREEVFLLAECRSARIAIGCGDAGRFLFLAHSAAESLRAAPPSAAIMGYGLFVGGALEALRAQDSHGLPELERVCCAPPQTPEQAACSLLSLTEGICSVMKEKVRGKNLALQPLLDYIGCSCFDPGFSIKSMADHFGTTSSNLSHFFKSKTGSSLSQHIQSIKITKAKELLCSTSLTLSEIIGIIGYADSSSFIRRFKAETGVTPGEYRASAGQR